MKISYAQGSGDNSCALIALLNALSFYGKRIPNIRSLTKLVKDIKIEYGMSMQDIFLVANKLNLHLTVVKNMKEIYIELLKKNMPILVSAHFLRYDIKEYADSYLLDDSIPIKIINFNLTHRTIIPAAGLSDTQLNNLHSRYTLNHTVCITQYDEKLDSFFCLNCHSGMNYWCSFKNMFFPNGPNNEQWDTSYLVMREPLKIVGNGIFNK